MDEKHRSITKVTSGARCSSLNEDVGCEDDWSGVTDPGERRKRQNRLRQRIWRERKRAIRNTGIATPKPPSDSWKGYGVLVVRDQSTGTEVDSSLAPSLPRYSWADHVVHRHFQTDHFKEREQPKPIAVPRLIPYATLDSLENGTLEIVFPLSADHRLITMIQYNVHRAALLNMAILNILDSLPLECNGSRTFSPLCIHPPNTIPPDLQYTPLQQRTPHPYWIKILPFPRMRDNLIRLAGTYDSRDLNYDLGKNLYEGFDSVEHRGCLVWGEPWTAYGWEASEAFLKKWGFLLAGCSDLVESTNRWRASRGEDRLICES